MERVNDIAVHSMGVGPGIVVVHGGGVTIDVYRRFATALADRFTVHLYNRRGRADAPPRLLPYTFEQEIDDLAAILAHTGATNVIGHSSGGFIALSAALRLPIARLALYDAAISVDGSAPAGWLPAAQAAARAGDLPRALAITAGGINTHQASSRWPLSVRVAIVRLFMRTPIGRTMGDLVPMTLDETALIEAADGPAEAWSGVTAEVLLACGAKGPRHYAVADEALAAALPHARAVEIANCAHDGINRAPRHLVDEFADFFASPITQRPGEPAR
ncbi:alpha/beta fold hydrolase [Asanoa sp. WMMD1127]|uniref:alpha/beta fold hydrolase n=1 Tax=Asanoa sp. WMMD1127 TaxID=3016107 RepID=UPI0024162ABE|nr:alpha/beta fold hydrolase [Asanoa sp. WMMD1127]MDG4823460.1 alpha/beta fold hydrolase [Asanoa sp. WMMD1127]